MLSYTICPLAGMNTDKSIWDVHCNAIYAISDRYIFSVRTCFCVFWRILLNILSMSKSLCHGFRKLLILICAQCIWRRKVIKASYLQFATPCKSWKIFLWVNRLCPALTIIIGISTGHVFLSASKRFRLNLHHNSKLVCVHNNCCSSTSLRIDVKKNISPPS